MNRQTLYQMAADATGSMLPDMEQALEALSAPSVTEEAFCEKLSELEQTGTAFRVDATRFLHTEETAAFEEDLVYDAKRHIHTDVGRVLNLSRAYLSGMTEAGGSGTVAAVEIPERADLVAEWQEVLQSLRTGEWRASETDVRQQITEAANAAGVKPVFGTEVPADEASRRAYIRDAAARILAAVRAGEASVTI